MTTDPDGQGPIRRCRGTGENLQILDVEMMREELRTDGTWGNATLIVPLPGECRCEEPGKPIPGRCAENGRDWHRCADLSKADVLPELAGREWLPPSERRDDRRLAELAARR